MPEAAEKVRSEALRLPLHERARLAEELIASLDEDAEVDAAWAQEIQRRIAEVESGAVELVDADEVMARLRASIRR